MAKKKNHTNRHHRHPTSIGGSNDQRNISIVSQKKHEAFHMLFSNMDAPEIARELNEKWINPDYILLPIFIGEKLTNQEIHNIIRKMSKALDY